MSNPKFEFLSISSARNLKFRKIIILSHRESLVEEIIALKYVLINGSHLFQAALFYIGINIQQYGAFLTKP